MLARSGLVLSMLPALLLTGCGDNGKEPRMAVVMTFRLTGSTDPRTALSTATGWVDRASKSSEVLLAGQSPGERVRREGQDVFSVGNSTRHHNALGGSVAGSPLGGSPDLPDPLGLLVLVQPKADEPAKTVSCARSFYAGCVAVHVQRSGSRLVVTYTDQPFGSPLITEAIEAVYTPCSTRSACE